MSDRAAALYLRTASTASNVRQRLLNREMLINRHPGWISSSPNAESCFNEAGDTDFAPYVVIQTKVDIRYARIAAVPDGFLYRRKHRAGRRWSVLQRPAIPRDPLCSPELDSGGRYWLGRQSVKRPLLLGRHASLRGCPTGGIETPEGQRAFTGSYKAQGSVR